MSEPVAAPPAAAPVVHPERILFLPDPAAEIDFDPAAIVLTCANCGAPMDERKCKLICHCGYFASCSDYY
jgi:hypothetical protein